MTITKITDHADAALATQQTWTHTRERIRKLCEILADEVQLLEDVEWQVLVNSLLENATGLILDEYGDTFDEPRGSLGDDDYRRVLFVIMGAHQSDGTAPETIYLASTLLDSAVRYQQYIPAHYRLEYLTTSPISGDWETRVLRILEILRPAGVNYALIEGDDPDAFRFDTGPGFDEGKLSRKVI